MAHRHTAEFKQEAVRIALTSGLTRRQVASDLGIGFSTLSKWIQKSRNNGKPDHSWKPPYINTSTASIIHADAIQHWEEKAH